VSGVDPAMNQALMAMLPVEVRAALEEGASPQDLMQSMLTAKLQAAEDVLASSEDVIDVEEPWPEVGWAAESEASMRDWSADGGFPSAPSSPLADRLVDLARALGACTLCLGDDPDCPTCAGSGAPGWNVPEPELFETLVAPALKRLQSESLRRAQETVGRAVKHGENANGHSQTN
jgi:hypothetical protein